MASVLNNLSHVLVPSRPPNTVSYVVVNSMSVETQSSHVGRNGGERSGERLSNGTVDTLGRRRFERVTLGVEHI